MGAVFAVILLSFATMPLFAIFLGKFGMLCQRAHMKLYPEAYERRIIYSSADEMVMKRLFSKKYEFDEYYNPPIR